MRHLVRCFLLLTIACSGFAGSAGAVGTKGKGSGDKPGKGSGIIPGKRLGNNPVKGSDDMPGKGLDTATFAAGCFWCTEAQFQQLRGVKKVVSGFCGGTVANPSYKQVCTGTTGHAEACNIIYDPLQISYDELLDYHQDYYNQNGSQPYCQRVIQPELEKFKKVFKDKLKN